jgi:CRISPR-associated exonuclease Cas4
MIFVLVIVLLLVGFWLIWQAALQRRSAGLPPGKIIYTDTEQSGRKLENALYDSHLGLTGKPDYIIEQGEDLIPVEIKSAAAPNAPYDSHIYQMAAYCLLIHRTSGKRPSHGILKYNNRSFAIDYTPELEDDLLSLLSEMRAQQKRGGVDRSHDHPARCARCGVRSACDQHL